MKRLIAAVLCLIISCSLVACGMSGKKSAAEAELNTEIQAEATPVPTPEPTPGPEELYEEALQTLYSCEFESAKVRFDELGNYEDSKYWSEYCDYRIEKASELAKPRYIKDGFRLYDWPNGYFYSSDLAYFYVPKEISSDTKCILYYPGGTGADYILDTFSMPYIVEYFPQHNPNAVIMLFKNSGYTNMKATNSKAIEMLHQLELDLNFVIHDMIIMSSSNGGFCANRAAVQLWTEGNIKVRKLFDMDNGMEWVGLNAGDNLNDEECDLLAEEGTKVYLFEQPGVGMDKEPIANMVNRGVDVTIVECKTKSHNDITVNMYRKDVFGWALEQYQNLDSEEYTLVKLEKNNNKAASK